MYLEEISGKELYRVHVQTSVPDLPIARGPPNKVYNIFNIVIDLSYTCCYNPPGFCNFHCTPFQNNTVFMGVAS